jgi:hypothetical protein
MQHRKQVLPELKFTDIYDIKIHPNVGQINQRMGQLFENGIENINNNLKIL